MTNTSFAANKDPYFTHRQRMVEEQIIARRVDDERVINAMLKVPRHLFIPDAFRIQSYSDHPIVVGHGQTISQPYIVAYMTEALELTPNDKVLEIGTGSGYQTALLAELTKEVYSMEIIADLSKKAQEVLKTLEYQNIHFRIGDGYQGWPEQSPFDAIIVTAAPSEIPPKLIEQLKVGGRMIIPIGDTAHQDLYFITKTSAGIDQKRLIPVRFVPMVENKHKIPPKKSFFGW